MGLGQECFFVDMMCSRQISILNKECTFVSETELPRNKRSMAWFGPAADFEPTQIQIYEVNVRHLVSCQRDCYCM